MTATAALGRHFRDLIEPCLMDPVRFVYDVIQAQPDPWQEAALTALVENKRAAVAGCNGCLGADAQIWDTVAAEGVPVGDIKSSTAVLSALGESKACPPVIKGRADLYRVTLSTGRSFECTLDHRVLTPVGYRRLRELSVSSFVVGTLPSITIQDIKFSRTGQFYDLHVPRGNSYLAEGAFHHNSGKDVLAVWTALWALTTRPFCKGQVTGPNKIQVFDTVWPEAKKWIDHSPILPHLILWTKTRLAWKEEPERAFISARTAAKRYSVGATGDAATEGIQGMHAEHLVIIITEASGVDDNNWEAAESCCTQPDNYILAVGNPLRRSGRFYDIFTKATYGGWARRHVSHRDSTWVDRARVDEWIARYGADSAFCQVRCFGRFPAEGDPDSAIPWDMVEGAMERPVPLQVGDPTDLQLGVDAARYGRDEFVIAVRRGFEIVELRIWKKISGPQGVGVVIQAVKDHGGNKETPIIADEAGLGSTGLVDPLLNDGYNVIGVTNSGTAVNEERYAAWDDEQWMETLHTFLKVGKLPRDDTLLAQLTTRKYEFTGRNEQQRRLESKKQMQRRGLQSPDRAEAVMMACAPPASWGTLHEHDAQDSYWSKHAGIFGDGGSGGGGGGTAHTPWGASKAFDPEAVDRDEDEEPDISEILDGMLM